MSDDQPTTTLMTRAADGDKQAWHALVERYAPLIWSICRSHRLGNADAEDVGQSVWLRLVEQLHKIRDPAALPGWLATTTRRECLRVQGAVPRLEMAGYALDAEAIPDERTGTAEQELLAAERTPRCAARGAPGVATRRPAADPPAYRGSARAVCRDQRQAGHPGREHRADPQPLPGQAA